jgi:hypothetical protein
MSKARTGAHEQAAKCPKTEGAIQHLGLSSLQIQDVVFQNEKNGSVLQLSPLN